VPSWDTTSRPGAGAEDASGSATPSACTAAGTPPAGRRKVRRRGCLRPAHGLVSRRSGPGTSAQAHGHRLHQHCAWMSRVGQPDNMSLASNGVTVMSTCALHAWSVVSLNGAEQARSIMPHNANSVMLLRRHITAGAALTLIHRSHGYQCPAPHMTRTCAQSLMQQGIQASGKMN